MKQAYYKNYRESLSDRTWDTVYFGFPKEKLPIVEIREMLERHYFSNEIIVTENLIIFSKQLSINRSESKKIFQKARMLDNVIIFAKMSYAGYKTTKTAKNIIIEKKINEKDFTYDNFISVHENKLSVETKISDYEISLELSNIDIAIEEMENERNKEIEQRILECLK